MFLFLSRYAPSLLSEEKQHFHRGRRREALRQEPAACFQEGFFTSWQCNTFGVLLSALLWRRFLTFIYVNIDSYSNTCHMIIQQAQNAIIATHPAHRFEVRARYWKLLHCLCVSVCMRVRESVCARGLHICTHVVTEYIVQACNGMPV